MATTPDIPEFTLDIREQVARIDSLLADTNQALVNAGKLRDESAKLREEAAKFSRDRSLAPWSMVIAILGGASAFFAAGLAVAKYLGT